MRFICVAEAAVPERLVGMLGADVSVVVPVVGNVTLPFARIAPARVFMKSWPSV